MMHFLGWLLGFENIQSVDSFDVTLAAGLSSSLVWMLIGGCVLAVGGVIMFYGRFEHCKSPSLRVALITLRAALLCVLLVTLAAPLLRVSATVVRLPLVYLLVDDSESMSVADAMPQAEQDALQEPISAPPSVDRTPISRTEQLRRLLGQRDGDLIRRLERQAGCRVEAFTFGGEGTAPLAKIDRDAIETGLDAAGKSTPLIGALAAIPKQARGERVAATIVFSDFVDTSDHAASDARDAAISASGSPIYTVGLGATALIDVAIDLRVEPKVKFGEPTTVFVDLRQSGLDGASATVSLEARALEYELASEGEAVRLIAERTVVMNAEPSKLEFSYTPGTSGHLELIAKVTPLRDEVLLDNNTATRQLTAIDDFLRITCIEYEPNWEWRFIKEVFQRDKLVGREGFRTYLASAAANVQTENTLFNPTLLSPRSEFFANDVLVLGDGPRELFSAEFCELAEEFVSRMGGGLVVVAGPRFGPQELAETPLGKMLPVLLRRDASQGDPNEFSRPLEASGALQPPVDARLADQTEFTLQRTTQASLFPFMQLADSEAENDAAWNNLGMLPWYQPVAGVHEHAQVLAEHPADRCDDGQTQQPLIAIRPYGRGQVVYVGFNEMWRLRKRYGDRYYQRFWSQLMSRLGMSHAVGFEKRFVVEFDRPAYRVGEEAVLTVEAFDDDYQPLGLSHLTAGALVGDLTVPAAAGSVNRKLSIPGTQPGHFEAVIPLPAAGRYSVRITDPISGRTHVRNCAVSDLSVERKQIVRNSELQRRIAAATGGTAYDVSKVDQLIADLALEPTSVQQHRQVALWTTPGWFLLVVGLMLSEWTLRKLMYLR